MAFKRVAQFDQIFIDSDNLTFGVYAGNPAEVTGAPVKYHGHSCPDGYTYLDRNQLYDSYETESRPIGLYETVSSQNLMPHRLAWPGSTGLWYVATLDNGGITAPYANDLLADAYTDAGMHLEHLLGGSDLAERIAYGGLNVRSIKLDAQIYKRWASDLGDSSELIDAGNKRINVDQYVEYLKTYKTRKHKIAPGWTWTDEDENSPLRAHIMWAPYQEVVDRSLDEEFYRKPFDGYLRIFSAVPVAPPNRDHNGYYDAEGDFHYLCMYRLYGISESPGVPYSTRLHPINDKAGLPKRSHMYVPEALMGNNPPKPYNVNIPSNHTFEAFRNYLQPDPSDYVYGPDDLVNKFYGGDPFVNFQVSYGFVYETYAQAFTPFGGVSQRFSLHPSNPYCGNYRGEAFGTDTDDVTHQEAKEYGGDAMWSPGREMPTHQLLAFQAKFDSRWFYIQKVDEFKASGALNEFKYDISYVRSGRLGSATAIYPNAIQWIFEDDDYEPDQGFSPASWNSVKPTKVDSVSQEMMVHKLRYPRPMNGEGISIGVAWGRRGNVEGGSLEYYMSHDADSIFDTHAEEDSAKYRTYSDEEIAMNEDARKQWDSYRKYVMYWGPIGLGGKEAKAYAKDYRKKMFYYGHEQLMYMLAWMKFENIVHNLNRLWVYDDTPKEARIRMQKNRGYDSSRLTSIVDSSLSAKFDVDYEEFLGKYIADDQRLRLGGTFTEKQVREAEEKLGVPEGTYDSRIGTSTSVSGRK